MSIVFMLGMVIAIFAGFGGLVFFTYKKSAAAGYQPEGKLRWSDGE